MKHRAARLASILLLAAAAAQINPARARAPEPHYRAFDTTGRAVTLREIVESLARADVLVLGERHDDAVTHVLEAELLRLVEETYARPGSGRRPRPVALSLEMFERDVQTILDEYLAGLISERHFLLSSRPWKNYETDYRPLVEYAKGRGLPVIAANAPARYVSRVVTNGPGSLRALSPEARGWLPPLPYPTASAEYAEKFRAVMQSTPHGANPHAASAPSYMLEAQTLRDASMADAVARFLKQRSAALVVHVNGAFHSEGRLGVPEQLKHYRAGARAVVVTLAPEASFTTFDAARHGRLGDFVILTDARASRPPS
ncbi:MAG TPA: ChaN family lipoprotein [Pyrinomonadaceae bacterium]|nr:ChaN family lipoprotein [Pyrinomonadaceae bacterium]